MTIEGCRQWRESLGLHALGQLGEPERGALEAHLEGCPACRAEADSLAGVAALLPLAEEERLGTVPEPPAGLAKRITAEIASERRASRRRRRRRTGLGLGLAAAAATAAVATILVLPTGDSAPVQQVEFASVPPGVQISAALEPHQFGTEIRMQVSGIRSGTLCHVFMRGAGGSRVSAGTFRYRYGGGSEAVLSSALDLSQARQIGVRAGKRTFIAPIEASTNNTASEEREYKESKT